MTKPRPQRDPESGRLLPENTANLKHGGFVWLRMGRLPSIKGRRRIQRQLNALRRSLMEAIPDSQDPRREILVSQVVRCEGYLLLAESYLRKAGILNPTALRKGSLETQPVLERIVSFMNTQQRAVAALGLDKETGKEVLDLGRYIELKDKEKAAKEGEVSK
jgi:hypothetical protein